MILLNADKNTQDISQRFGEHETTQEQLLKKGGEQRRGREGSLSGMQSIIELQEERSKNTYLNSRGNATKRHRNM
jgi:hypothetical protein